MIIKNFTLILIFLSLVLSVCAAKPAKSETVTSHKDSYIVWNAEKDSSDDLENSQVLKFQTSFKSKLRSWPKNKSPDQDDEMNKIFFAFSLQSIWDISSPSIPMLDITFNPEFFYQLNLKNITPEKNSLLNCLRFGIEHESNGKDGPSSRSWNKVYFQVQRLCKPYDKKKEFNGYFNGYIKLWVPFAISDKNKDITDFIGYYELRGEYKHPLINFFGIKLDDWIHLGLTVRHGAGISRQLNGNFQFDLKWLFDNDDPLALYIQFWRGYGENLLEYNQFQESKAKLGLSLNW
ncbi:MAG: hypothetical protein CMD96_06185 [Gammaproteobacteria bacterium]|nr:hypothetical protein [Gammaproteobacteria bacterium]